MNLKLIKLTEEYKQELAEMIEEWKEDQAKNNTDLSPHAIFREDYHDFDKYLASLDRKVATTDRVPSSTYFLLDQDRNRLLGAVNIRHCLNDALKHKGGHIGDGIRPSERKKGYATEIIRLALLECKRLGLDKVLMTCDKDNIGSAKSITNNGGLLDSEFVDERGVVCQRYWIRLED